MDTWNGLDGRGMVWNGIMFLFGTGLYSKHFCVEHFESWAKLLMREDDNKVA